MNTHHKTSSFPIISAATLILHTTVRSLDRKGRFFPGILLIVLIFLSQFLDCREDAMKQIVLHRNGVIEPNFLEIPIRNLYIQEQFSEFRNPVPRNRKFMLLYENIFSSSSGLFALVLYSQCSSVLLFPCRDTKILLNLFMIILLSFSLTSFPCSVIKWTEGRLYFRQRETMPCTIRCKGFWPQIPYNEKRTRLTSDASYIAQTDNLSDKNIGN